ncbi:hypothetical protein MPL1032_180051 [Mesorhizobium plurifarium]|uniref:Uncharacterized protein n=1 Tax=Mesorhizobium plurifarium TaxID=69974 RepID=A0A0K2VU74_MESPL|nr:hypothetical protein MPL1032_180051 [Mesorhizobium plurifarium]
MREGKHKDGRFPYRYRRIIHLLPQADLAPSTTVAESGSFSASGLVGGQLVQ